MRVPDISAQRRHCPDPGVDADPKKATVQNRGFAGCEQRRADSVVRSFDLLAKRAGK